MADSADEEAADLSSSLFARTRIFLSLRIKPASLDDLT